MAATAIAALTVLPLAIVAGTALGHGLDAAWAQIWRPRVGELMVNTVTLVVVTVLATTVIGIATAWLVERTIIPAPSLWRVLFVAPLAVPAFVTAYGWVALRPNLSGLWGATLISTLAYFPFVFLPVSAVLRRVDPAQEDSARSLGLGTWRTFFRIVLPQLRPAVLGGALLVALHLLAEFGVLAMLRYPTFTTAILEQFEVAYDMGAGAALAMVLMSLTVTVLTIEYLLRGTRRVARLGSGVGRTAVRAWLGRWQLPVLLAMTGLVALTVGVPVYSIGHWLGKDGAPIVSADLVHAMTSTIGLALAAGVLTTVAAFPVAVLLHSRRNTFTTTVERLTYLASSLPGVVIALALVTASISVVRPLYQTPALLVLAYANLFIPRAMVSIRAALAHAPDGLVDAARALGSTPWDAFRRVLVPLTLPGIMVGFAMVVIAASTELTATLLLSPTGMTTLSVGFWDASSTLDYATAAPYAAAMILLSAPLTYVLLHQPDRSES